MSYAPRSISVFAAYWVGEGGVNLGIVGNTKHTKGYHLGKDRIYDGSGPGIGDADYSVQLARDKAGLTNAASAIDLGRLGGSLSNLWKFSRWFADQCMARNPVFKDVREVIFWHPQTEKVFGWSSRSPDKFISDYGDLSHKTHTHISFFRDSENRDKTAMLRAYPPFAPVPVPEDDVILSQNLPGYTATIRKTANIRSAPTLTAPVLRVVGVPENWALTGAVKGAVDPDGGSDQWYLRWGAAGWEYTAASNLIAPPLKPASQAELSKAKQEAADARLLAEQSAVALTACNTKVSNAKTALG